jgi:hypothetical protein
MTGGGEGKGPTVSQFGEGEGKMVSQIGEGEGPTVSQFEGIVEGPTGFAVIGEGDGEGQTVMQFKEIKDLNDVGDGEGRTVMQFEEIKNLNAVKSLQVIFEEIKIQMLSKVRKSRSKEQKGRSQ